LNLEDVVVLPELYPRFMAVAMANESSQSFQAIESYILSWKDLPPIVVNQDNILIDGWHRLEAFKWMAERIMDGDLTDEETEDFRGFDLSIEVEVRDTPREEILFVAARENARGQVPMSREEKHNTVIRLCFDYSDNEIADALRIPLRTVQYWTKDAKAEHKKLQQQEAFKRIDKGESQREVYEDMGVPRSTMSDWVRDREKIEESWRPVIETIIQDEDEEAYAQKQRALPVSSEAVQESLDGSTPSPTIRADVGRALPSTSKEPIIKEETPSYTCDGFDPDEGYQRLDYLRVGCLVCKNLRHTPFQGLRIEVECKKGHELNLMKLERER
jgi:hypothetical protein